MVYNSLFGIWCYECNKYLDPYTEVYLPDGFENEGRICCFNDHIIGYTWDREWKELFGYECEYYYIEHNKGQCRCTQEETNCEGLIYQCVNPTGRECYEQDLKEENE